MADSRVFQKAPGITIDGIGRSVQNYLHNSHNLEVQGGKTGQGGYVVQAKGGGGWKSIAGMDSALEVQISDIQTGFLVNIGNAKWSDKIGAGVVGAFIFAPLAVTSIVGSVKQSKLPGQIFEHIEHYIASGGRDVYLGADLLSSAAGTHICPKCKAEVPDGFAFCNSCGTPMTITCPKCGEAAPLGTAFCPKCGADVNAAATQTCPKCGAECAKDATFCSKCGNAFAKQEVPALTTNVKCPKCGTENASDDSFCCECGERINMPAEPEVPQKNICPDCGAELAHSVKFCSKCGHKF